MCCILAALGLVGPRLALVVWWLIDRTRVLAPFDGRHLLGLLGLVFLPWTTLAWVVAWRVGTHVSGFGWFIVALGVLFDLSSYGGGKASRRPNRRERAAD